MNEPVRYQESCGIAITSLVCGVLSIVCFGPIAAIPAIICGHIALTRIKRAQGTIGGAGLAIAGFTLGYVGLAISLFIMLPMVIAIVLPNFMMARNKAYQHSCEVNMKVIERSIEGYQIDKGNLPADLDSLSPDYIKTTPVDPWGNEFIYTKTADGYTLISTGKDGIENENDITITHSPKESGQ